MVTIRDQLDRYVEEKYRIDPELLPFSHENYAIYRHKDTGRWFAVFIVKDRQVFGLPGSGDKEIVSFKIKDPVLTDLLAQQPGYLRGYPSSKWNWLSAVLDGTITFEDICRWINMSYEATKAKPGNKKGRIILEKLRPIIYDEEQVRYLALGDKIADAFKTGMAFRQALEDKER